MARALLRGGDLLVFDEPTAGLDVESERVVLDAIRAAAHEDGHAVLLIAHRPAALAIADTTVTIAARSEGSPGASAGPATTPLAEVPA